jgi:hypothetical protein
MFSNLQFPPLALNIFFSFSNNQEAVLFFFFLSLLFPSNVIQWHHEDGNLFSEYNQYNWLQIVLFLSNDLHLFLKIKTEK